MTEAALQSAVAMLALLTAPPAWAQSVTTEATPPVVDRSLLPRDLSPWGMFMAADIVVKIVMVGLAVASVLVWTIWIAKTIELFWARRRIRRDLAALRGQVALHGAGEALGRRRSGIAAAMVNAAETEWQVSGYPVLGSAIADRIHTRLSDLEANVARRIRFGTGFIATVGATAPFIGLFGTVWGIMNSFIGISKSQTTNLAVVAPGIAEALLATAIGLVAAIPAVILYNQLSQAIGRFRGLVRETSSEIGRVVSRQLEGAVSARTEPVRRAAE